MGFPSEILIVCTQMIGRAIDNRPYDFYRELCDNSRFGFLFYSISSRKRICKIFDIRQVVGYNIPATRLDSRG